MGFIDKMTSNQVSGYIVGYYREFCTLTQSGLAELSGLSRNQIVAAESGNGGGSVTNNQTMATIALGWEQHTCLMIGTEAIKKKDQFKNEIHFRLFLNEKIKEQYEAGLGYFPKESQ